MSVDRDQRRRFLLSAGRTAAFCGLAGTLGHLLRRGAPARAAGTPCGPPGRCVACPELRSCGLPSAREVLAVSAGPTVWQLDPTLCVQCGGCSTNCVLEPSAVKAVNSYGICGYCKLCFGYFQPGVSRLDEGAEHQLCPVGAIQRSFVENPYYEYTIDEDLCVACGKCVDACALFGNGSFYLQVRHDRCLGCNECSVAVKCPAGAYRRVPASAPYLTKEPRGS